MALTTDDIFKAIALRSGRRGFAQVHLRRAHQQQGNYGPRQRAFLKDLADTPSRDPKPTVVHPLDQARRRGTEGRAGDAGPRHTDTALAEELGPVELMWLQRLPTDPAQVSFEDAVRLARMVDSVRTNTPSGMLLRSIWEPVDLLHTERVTKARIANLDPPVTVSQLAYGALTEATAAGLPELHEDEAGVRARRLGRDFEAEQREQHDRAKTELQADLQRVRDRRAERAQTTSPTPIR